MQHMIITRTTAMTLTACMQARVEPPPFRKTHTYTGLTQLLDYYAGNDEAANGSAAAGSSGAGAAGERVAIDPKKRLTAKEFAAVRSEAVKRVRVPQHVIQLVADLRWGAGGRGDLNRQCMLGAVGRRGGGGGGRARVRAAARDPAGG